LKVHRNKKEVYKLYHRPYLYEGKKTTLLKDYSTAKKYQNSKNEIKSSLNKPRKGVSLPVGPAEF